MRPIRCESNFNDIPPIGDTAKVVPGTDPATRDRGLNFAAPLARILMVERYEMAID